MATGAENLEAALASVRQEIASVAATGLAPSYGIDGQSVDMVAYMASLLEREKMLVEALIIAQGPFEMTIQGVP